MATRSPLFVMLFVLAACRDTSAPTGTPEPEAVIATATHGQINISWRDLTQNKATYEVEYSLDATNWQPLQKAAGITSAVQTGIEYQITYYYRVRACIGTECSPWAQVSTQWTGGQGPEVLGARAIPGTVSASLSGSVDHGGIRTVVYFIVTPEGGTTFRTPDIILTPRVSGLQEATSVQSLVYGLTEGKNYTIVLTATNGAGTSQASAAFRTSVTGPPLVQLNTTRPDPIASVNDAHVGSTVDPGGLTTQTWFEVTAQDSAFATAPHYAGLTISSGFVSNVSVTLPTLRAATSYKWRAGASNSLGTTYSDSAFFKTQ